MAFIFLDRMQLTCFRPKNGKRATQLSPKSISFSTALTSWSHRFVFVFQFFLFNVRSFLQCWSHRLASAENKDQLELINILLFPRNPVNSSTEGVKVDLIDLYSEWYITALLASGFRLMPDNRTDYALFLPCSLGTFSNSSSKGKQGCIECPPGIFLVLVTFLQISIHLIFKK